MKNFVLLVVTTVLNLAVGFILFITTKPYQWAVLKKAELKSVVDKRHVVFAEEVFRTHLQRIWKRKFSMRVARVHKGKVRFDAVIIMDNKKNEYVLRFERYINPSLRYIENVEIPAEDIVL